MTRLRIFCCLFFSLVCGPLHAETLVAVVGAMSGPYGTLGGLMRTGAAQAVLDINDAGGVNGDRLALEVFDDTCDVEKATAIANQIAGKGIRLVVGHLCSSTSIAAAAIYAQHGVVLISPASSNPKLTDERAGAGVFRIFSRSDQQSQAAADYIIGHFQNGGIAIVHDATAYGKGLADELKQHLNSAGVQEVMFDAYRVGATDYSDLVAKLKTAEPELVYIGGTHQEAAAFVRAMRDQGIASTIMSGDALATDEYWALAGSAAQGTLITFPPDARKNPAAENVVAAFREANIEPESYVLYAYAAVQAWAQAATAAGSLGGEPVSTSLGSGSFETVLGTVSFDAKGDVNLPGFEILEWTDGKLSKAN